MHRKSGIIFTKYSRGSEWWLRSPGSVNKYASYVCNDGYIDDNGNLVNLDNYGVRPSLRIRLTSSEVIKCEHASTVYEYSMLHVQDKDFRNKHKSNLFEIMFAVLFLHTYERYHCIPMKNMA